MNKENIKAKANLMIGYANFERNEYMKKIKIKHLVTVAIAFTVFISSILTVNALTDNSIGNAITKTVENVLKVKINDKDYNAKCQTDESGHLKCTVDPNLVNGAEIEIEKTDPKNNDVDLEIEIEEN